MSKIILSVIYAVLILASIYNLYSFKPDVGLGIKLEKGISDSLQHYIVIHNIQEEPLKDLDILVNEKYYLHIYKIDENDSYNAFATEFIDIAWRPGKASGILLQKEKKKIKEIEKMNDIFNKKIKVSVFKSGESYHKEL